MLQSEQSEHQRNRPETGSSGEGSSGRGAAKSDEVRHSGDRRECIGGSEAEG